MLQAQDHQHQRLHQHRILMADLLLDEDTGSLDLSGGTIKITPTFADSLKQRLQIRFSLFLGEYVFDTTAGIDYYGQVLRKGVTKEFLDNFFTVEIEETVGVERLESFSSNLSSVDRTYSIDFTVLATDGSTVTTSL